MNNKDFISQPLSVIIYLILQIIFLHNVMLFDGAFCFVYVAILLFLPFRTNSMMLLFLGFGIGLIVDLSYSVLGIHTAATVFLAYMRNTLIKRIEPTSGYEGNAEPFLSSMGLSWFAKYSLPLIFVHHALVFFIEVSNRHFFWVTLLKTLGSSLFTFLVILLIQYIFYKKK